MLAKNDGRKLEQNVGTNKRRKLSSESRVEGAKLNDWQTVNEKLGEKLIILPGNLTSSFFVNEIPYFKSAFREVTVIAFGKCRKEEAEIVKKYDLNCKFCSLRNFNWVQLRNFLKWLRIPYVREEIKEYVTFSKMGINRLAYILFYGLYYVITEPILIQEIENNNLDIYLYAFWLSRPAFCLSNMKEKYPKKIVKICARAHRYDLYEKRNSANYLPFRSYISKKLDTIYFISEDGKRYYEKFCKRKSFQGVCDLKLSRLGTSNPSKLKKEIFIKEKILIASCSSVILVKRIDLIIEVIAFLQNHGIDVQWIHIGDGELMSKMQALSLEKLKRNSYHFLGNIKNSKILQIYIENDVDYFINLSDSEGIPVSIMEAISIGLPVIARDVGGNSEIVNGDNGCILGKKGKKSEILPVIYEFVKKRLSSVEDYKRLSDNARLQWEDLYSAEKNYKSFYQDLWCN